MSRTSLNVHTLTEEDADIPYCTYLGIYIALPPPPGSSRIYATFFLFESGTEFILFYFVLFLFLFYFILFLCDVMHNYLVSTRK